jgi:hypothetical protein
VTLQRTLTLILHGCTATPNYYGDLQASSDDSTALASSLSTRSIIANNNLDTSPNPKIVMPKPPRRRRFRHTAHEPFQPLRTLLHILLLQSIYYLTATILILFTSLVSGKPFSLDLIFSWRAVRGDTTVGWTLGVVWILCGIAMSVLPLSYHL